MCWEETHRGLREQLEGGGAACTGYPTSNGRPACRSPSRADRPMNSGWTRSGLCCWPEHSGGVREGCEGLVCAGPPRGYRACSVRVVAVTGRRYLLQHVLGTSENVSPCGPFSHPVSVEVLFLIASLANGNHFFENSKNKPCSSVPRICIHSASTLPLSSPPLLKDF